MNIENFRDILAKDGPSEVFGIEYISTPDEDECVSRMLVTDKNTQPFGFLSGGVTLAMAETVAGVASSCLCPDRICVGMNVQANHVHSAFKGDVVTATAKIVHRGVTTHVWRVDVTNSKGQLVTTATVTNYIVAKN